MTGRAVGAVGAVVALVLLGAAVGYALAPPAPEVAAPTAFASAEPLAAQSPGLPVDTFRPDPDDPALDTAIELRTALLSVPVPTPDGDPGADAGAETAYRLSVPVPVGWQETRPSPVRWQYTVPANDDWSYGLRIDVVAASGLSATSARQSRESQLRSALLQGSFTDLDVTEDPAGDGFTARYVQDGYERYTLERFYPGPDPDRVFATVAVYGRARDVAGLSDLLERISIDLRPLPSAATQTP